ncbi:MAG: hypothetical protein NTU44_13475 [Bacteroidetes bacterium]|nr:hypothetical protein [Bacteroidota bacterium]
MYKLFILISIIFIIPSKYLFSQQESKDDSKPTFNLIGFSVGSKGYTDMVNDNIPTSMVFEFPQITVSTSPSIKLFAERNIGTVFSDMYIGIGGEICHEQSRVNASHGIYYFPDPYSYSGEIKMSINYFALRLSLNYVLPSDPDIRFYGTGSYGIMFIKSTGKETFTNYSNSGSITSINSNTINNSASVNLIQSYVGMRYFILKSLACYGEAGYGLSYCNLGLNLRF